MGKSTLLNALVGEKIAIVSDKPQTTRNKIIGIYNSGDVQLVFVDTPGLHTPKNKLGEHMIKEINDANDGVDAVLFVAECRAPGKFEYDLIEKFKSMGVPVILVINKIDKVNKSDILEVIKIYSEKYSFESVVPVSALNLDGVNIIMDELLRLAAADGVLYYPDDISTVQTVRQMASEIVREKILRNMYEEIPHGVAVEPVVFKERTNKNGDNITDIVVNIICERSSHKGMIIGKNGEMLKKMASEARKELETLTGTKVYLECHVKVKENWRDNEKIISELGLYE